MPNDSTIPSGHPYCCAATRGKTDKREHVTMALICCMASQEIESILDNPGEMADMHLADKEAALNAEAEQV